MQTFKKLPINAPNKPAMKAIVAGVMTRSPSSAGAPDDTATKPRSVGHEKEIDGRIKLSFTSAGAIPYNLT
jgi:hypothetical protein